MAFFETQTGISSAQPVTNRLRIVMTLPKNNIIFIAINVTVADIQITI
jgi:hypothetical protein